MMATDRVLIHRKQGIPKPKYSPTSADDLAHSVCGGGHILQRNREHAEQQNLDGCARGIPRGGYDMRRKVWITTQKKSSAC